MVLKVYTGATGSGKSLEMIKSVIIPALAKGINVTATIDGLKTPKIHDYIETKLKIPKAKHGVLRCMTEEDVVRPDFFPWQKQHYVNGEGIKATHYLDTDSVVKGGDLVVIDEAWRYWPMGAKLTERTQEFFRNHRHWTGGNIQEDTGKPAPCEIVFGTQDPSDVNKFCRTLVKGHFRMARLDEIGLDNFYTVEQWGTLSIRRSARLTISRQKYDPDIFELYDSFGANGGANVTVDKRTNVLKSPQFIRKIVLSGVFVFGSIGYLGYQAYSWYYSPAMMKSRQPAPAPNTSKEAAKAGPGRPAAIVAPPLQPYSTEWRLVGLVRDHNRTTVALKGASQFLRYEDASTCVFAGPRPTYCLFDGARVTYFSGPAQTAAATTPTLKTIGR